MSGEELAQIHADWEEQIKTFRNRPPFEDLTPAEQDIILMFIKQARTPTKEGIVSYQNITKLIRDTLGQSIGKEKVAELAERIKE